MKSMSVSPVHPVLVMRTSLTERRTEGCAYVVYCNCLTDNEILGMAGLIGISFGQESFEKQLLRMAVLEDMGEAQWYVMRDLKRANASEPAYKLLRGMGMEVFTPMRWRLATRRGARVREEVPLIRDLVFVHETRKTLDTVVSDTPTFQYRWLRGTWREPMTVGDAEMDRFIRAVNASESPRYYLPGEITPSMCGRRIRVVGGPLDGYEGNLLRIRGSRVRRLIVELAGFLAAGVEVEPEYIEFVE